LTVSATNPGKSLLVVSGEGGEGNSIVGSKVHTQEQP
jgi:hypothetical protein